jgi:hypothetical protein
VRRRGVASGRLEPRDADHLLEQAVEFFAWIDAETGVDRTGLKEGAGRRRQPVPAFAEAERGDGTGGGIPGADARDEGELAREEIDCFIVEVGREGDEAATIELDAGVEESSRAADEDNAHVEAFAALDAGNDADDDVLKRRERWRG